MKKVLGTKLTAVLVIQNQSGKSFMMLHVLKDLKKQCLPDLNIHTMNEEEFMDYSKQSSKISHIPTTFIMEDKEVLYQFHGLVSIEELKAILL
ncbi:MAG: hypothetical protein AAF849_21530 [Bacteroidota bacterium]